jgi:hypothetical protein
VIDFWVAISEVILIVRRLIREAWSRYRAGRLGLLADHDLLAEALIRNSDRETTVVRRLVSVIAAIPVRHDPSLRPAAFPLHTMLTGKSSTG